MEGRVSSQIRPSWIRATCAPGSPRVPQPAGDEGGLGEARPPEVGPGEVARRAERIGQVGLGEVGAGEDAILHQPVLEPHGGKARCREPAGEDGRVAEVGAGKVEAGKLAADEGGIGEGGVGEIRALAGALLDRGEGEVRPDCRKRYTEDCIGIWNNGINFKGEPLIPVGDASAVQTPGAQLPGGGGYSAATPLPDSES